MLVQKCLKDRRSRELAKTIVPRKPQLKAGRLKFSTPRPARCVACTTNTTHASRNPALLFESRPAITSCPAGGPGLHLLGQTSLGVTGRCHGGHSARACVGRPAARRRRRRAARRWWTRVSRAPASWGVGGVAKGGRRRRRCRTRARAGARVDC